MPTEPETVVESLVIDLDPTDKVTKASPVTVALELPPRATSNGWGERPGRR